MDVDLLKSSRTDDQTMEMMMMMMQMDKLPAEFSAGVVVPHQDDQVNTELPSMDEFSAGGGTTTGVSTSVNDTLTPHHHHHHHQHNFDNSSSPQYPLSFLHDHQEPAVPPISSSNASTMAAGSRLRHEYLSAFSSPPQPSKRNSMAAMREMIFRIAAMQPIHIDPESVKPPKRKNVKISKDPQSVAARHRRERISERIRILQRLVPGGTKMDTASMLDEAIHYVKFLKTQVQSLERAAANSPTGSSSLGGFTANYSSLAKAYQYLPPAALHHYHHHHQHQMFSPTHQMLN